MDKYEAVEKSRPESSIMDNEIRIATQGTPRNYTTYAVTLLRERGASKVTLKAMGNAISKAVTVAEIIKRRIPNLHQNTTISSTPLEYTWKPLKEGFSPLQTVRHVSTITITLSTTQLGTSSAGYQPPLPADQVKPLLEYEYEGQDSQFVLGRGRARGRRGNAASQYQNGEVGRSAEQSNGKYNDFGMGGGYLPPRARGHGRGNRYSGNGRLNDNDRFNGKGSGGIGRNRFGYGANYSDTEFRRGQGGGQGRVAVNDEDGWTVVSRRRGRARGRGSRN